MIHKKNIILTGELHCGKSTLVRRFLEKYSISYKGIFSEPVVVQKEIVGYALRLIDEPGIRLYAHTKLNNSDRFEKFALDLNVFDDVASYIEKCLHLSFMLFVVDEVGIFEDSVHTYQSALKKMLDSKNQCLYVVQKRADFLNEMKQRDDTAVLELRPNREKVFESIILRIMASYFRDR